MINLQDTNGKFRPFGPVDSRWVFAAIALFMSTIVVFMVIWPQYVNPIFHTKLWAMFQFTFAMGLLFMGILLSPLFVFFFSIKLYKGFRRWGKLFEDPAENSN